MEEQRSAGCLNTASEVLVVQQASLFGATGHGCRPVGRVLFYELFFVLVTNKTNFSYDFDHGGYYCVLVIVEYMIGISCVHWCFSISVYVVGS